MLRIMPPLSNDKSAPPAVPLLPLLLPLHKTPETHVGGCNSNKPGELFHRELAKLFDKDNANYIQDLKA
jgi:hypothetical protein